jgi:protein transport protein SEC24
MQPADKTLKTMALELAEFQVCVDLFLTSQNYVDIASLAVIPRSTGGQIYYYHGFQANVDSAKLYNDLRWNVTRPQGLEAVMRVRCSNGLQVQDYFGNFCKRNPTDVDLPAIDCDKTIMVTFKHDDKFQDNADCCFQSALLYTTTDGQRRIRINTLSLSCTTGLSHLFRGADLDAQFTYFLKQAAQDVPNTPVVQLRDRMTGQCVTILYTYRKFCATASSAGQLILPEALKLLPLYTMALTKSVGLRTDVRIDERSYWLSRVASLSASMAIPLVYPRMFAIHNLQSKDELGGAILPPVVPLSSENLDHDGIFLLETGEDAFLYVGKQASPEVLYKLFGVRSVDEVVTGQVQMQDQLSTDDTLQVLFDSHPRYVRVAVKISTSCFVSFTIWRSDA